jgi:hypothetical protein
MRKELLKIQNPARPATGMTLPDAFLSVNRETRRAIIMKATLRRDLSFTA